MSLNIWGPVGSCCKGSLCLLTSTLCYLCITSCGTRCCSGSELSQSLVLRDYCLLGSHCGGLLLIHNLTCRSADNAAAGALQDGALRPTHEYSSCHHLVCSRCAFPQPDHTSSVTALLAVLTLRCAQPSAVRHYDREPSLLQQLSSDNKTRALAKFAALQAQVRFHDGS